MDYSKVVQKEQTKQTEPILGREKEMVQNNAGGYVFTVDKWSMLNRFLILGTEGGTYYQKEKEITMQNAKNVIECIKEDASRVLSTVLYVSDNGLAFKNDPAIFVLALIFSYGNKQSKKDAAFVMNKICRTGTHMFMFAHYVNNMRGWGRAVRRSFTNWYSMPADKLEYQLVKYQGRTVEGTKNTWTHLDILRSAHVNPQMMSEKHQHLFEYLAKGNVSEDMKLVNSINELKKLSATKKDDVKKAIDLIAKNNIPQEAWPTEFMNIPAIWDAHMTNMPLTATIRNLGRLTTIGVLTQESEATKKILDKFNKEYILKSRVHPMTILQAFKIYSRGAGEKGSLTWKPVNKIVDGLDSAFYMSFANVEPTGKNIMLALDVSGSMGGCNISGSSVLTCREASAAIALITASVEKDYSIYGFSNEFIPLNISPRQRLDDIIRAISRLPFSSTDCSLPMVYAKQKKLNVDCFVVYTDNETYAGCMHPIQALKQYRESINEKAKSAVVSMTATSFTIADPKDSGMLDLVGCSTETPQIISSFARGDF